MAKAKPFERWREFATYRVRIHYSNAKPRGWRACLFPPESRDIRVKDQRKFPQTVIGNYATPEAALEAAQTVEETRLVDRLCTPRDIERTRKEVRAHA